ncbi:winged helix-turn-helix domain-containing protein [Massilia sp. CCM 9210]|uniref:helix-turn-helix domain-containing protein n=1 Tax=Massilia scottii TaxID=3057166 RepID=UPI002796AD15|nr:winged helix-turn-helix domain-containing protein [Massilia sp. CCM 9210]MDQ1816002.1 winged helix-turn-helix domain-containing protein [Massilia sp. CCM 9210]
MENIREFRSAAACNELLAFSGLDVSVLNVHGGSAGFVCDAGVANILLVDSREHALLDAIAPAQRVARGMAGQRLWPAPLILAVDAHQPPPGATGSLALTADWVFAPVSPTDLLRRASVLLQRMVTPCHSGLDPAKARAPFASAPSLTLHAASLSVAFQERTIRLSRTEFMLVDLFLSRTGGVVSFGELSEFFQTQGKADTRSNIRVGIFELRLKLEQLSGCALGLVSIYRQGYALRHTSGRAPLQCGDYLTSGSGSGWPRQSRAETGC